mmetsp:Transcript_3552/g.10095  ORF Transcript_3552/g.10095 Transcript_3552/m.10095 type:complete len:211 (-) Transcript_3552:1120-1752(-)
MESSSPPPPPVRKIAGPSRLKSCRERKGAAGGNSWVRWSPEPNAEALVAFTHPPTKMANLGEVKGPELPNGGLRTNASVDPKASRNAAEARCSNRCRTSNSVRGRMPGKSAAPPTSTMLWRSCRNESPVHAPEENKLSKQFSTTSGNGGLPLILRSNRNSGTKTRSTSKSMSGPLGFSTLTGITPWEPAALSQSCNVCRRPPVCGMGGAT